MKRNGNAQFQLGHAYDNGDRVKQNYTEAVRWCRKSAEQGNVDAQYFLGVACANGNGVMLLSANNCATAFIDANTVNKTALTITG